MVNSKITVYLRMLSGTCLNIDALIEGFDCRLLVDTGSPVSILSEPFFSLESS